MKKFSLVLLFCLHLNSLTIKSNDNLYESLGGAGIIFAAAGCYQLLYAKNNDLDAFIYSSGGLNALKNFKVKLMDHCGSMQMSLLEDEIQQWAKLNRAKILKQLFSFCMILGGIVLMKYSYDKVPAK